jgi:hypothetical protein
MKARWLIPRSSGRSDRIGRRQDRRSVDRTADPADERPVDAGANHSCTSPLVFLDGKVCAVLGDVAFFHIQGAFDELVLGVRTGLRASTLRGGSLGVPSAPTF